MTRIFYIFLVVEGRREDPNNTLKAGHHRRTDNGPISNSGLITL